MAGTGLLALLDDITALLDDVATMTKVAAVKTAGVTGDDLAVSAEQLSGLAAAREIPVVAAVAKGSLKNKAILIPATMAISALSAVTGLPLIAPLLFVGGTYLCHEGIEKIVHKKDSHAKEKHLKMIEAAIHDNLEEFEKKKIKAAIRTDLILSGEIMILALGTIAEEPLLKQLAVMIAVALGMTVFVYGLVAVIVKLDDAGLYLTKKEGRSRNRKMLRTLGFGILAAAPLLMKFLTVVGTVAMFMVGGGILLHIIPALEALTHELHGLAGAGVSIIAGLIAGSISVVSTKYLSKAYKKVKRSKA